MGKRIIATYDRGRIQSPSMASAAANFLSTCGSERGEPECSTQSFPMATPHVGQGTEDICSGVSSFLFIRKQCNKAERRGCPILNTLGIIRYRSEGRYLSNSQ